MRYIDLHTHSLASDGALSPTELVRLAAQSRIGVLALTDHDTIAGVAEAVAAGEKYGVRIIPGVELTTVYEREVHILGLYVDIQQPDLTAAMAKLCEYRAERNRRILENLNAQGLKISEADVLKHKPGYGMDTIGRVHMARALVEKAYSGDIASAIKEHISNASPAYVQRKLLDVRECIDLIHKAGGYAFLAHGFRSEPDPDKLLEMLNTLRGYGIDGVECYHTGHDVKMTEKLTDYCEKHDLLVSGGSDFHGEYKPHVQLATMPYGLKLPIALLQQLNTAIEEKRKGNLD